MVSQDLHNMAGPTDDQQHQELEHRNRRFRVLQFDELIRRAWSHHRMGKLLKELGRNPTDERIMRDDCMVRARALKQRLGV
jgi:hypothetical protein